MTRAPAVIEFPEATPSAAQRGRTADALAPAAVGRRPVLASRLIGAGAAAVLLGALVLAATLTEGRAPYIDGPRTGGAPSSPLSWAPPELDDPVTYHVSGDGPGTLRAKDGEDSVVVWDKPTHRRIRFEGGRHWVIRGAEVHNDVAWKRLDDRAALEFSDVQGTVFIEGLLVHGKSGTDGIRLGPDTSDTTLVLQNSRILDRLSQGGRDYHADIVQAYGGVQSLHIDHLTGRTNFQGQMWLQEDGTTFGPSVLRHVNYDGLYPQSAPLVNLVMKRPTGPVSLTDVWSQPADGFAGGEFCRAHRPLARAWCRIGSDGVRQISWKGTPIEVEGVLRQGPPPGGDMVPKGVAGLDYVSPGYLGGPVE